jgi:uncharacterized protein (TIGR02594 family)
MPKLNKQPPWLINALTKVGIKEIAGSKHNPTILAWLKLLKAWWSNDEEPWCGTFIAICLKEVQLPIIKNWFRAKDWAVWGDPISPRLGALLVFGREGGGHVGWYVGEAVRKIDGKKINCYRVLGGNQSNMVCETWIPASRMISCRWPKGIAVTTEPVYLIDDNGLISVNEA